jgi:hypothetical protein
MPCPRDKKFEREGASGSYKCVYWPDKQFSVNLTTVGTAIFDGVSLEDLRMQDTAKYTEFTTEKDRVDQALTVVYANIDKQQKLNDAFRDLQAAENARDRSPEAYQVARTAYYTLLRGDTWVNEERERIAKSEVEPELQKYKSSLTNIDIQNQNQQRTIDIVQGVKDKVLTLKDDFKYSVDTLSDQVEKVKMQINLDNRSREKQKDTTWTWIDTILNVILVGSLIYVGYVLYRKYYPRIVGQPPTYTSPA